MPGFNQPLDDLIGFLAELCNLLENFKKTGTDETRRRTKLCESTVFLKKAGIYVISPAGLLRL